MTPATMAVHPESQFRTVNDREAPTHLTEDSDNQAQLTMGSDLVRQSHNVNDNCAPISDLIFDTNKFFLFRNNPSSREE